jgi:uncharacterized protein (DUF2164 family)
MMNQHFKDSELLLRNRMDDVTKKLVEKENSSREKDEKLFEAS